MAGDEQKNGVARGPDGVVEQGQFSAGKSPEGKTRPLPTSYNGIEVNFCKTPGCQNFGVSASLTQPRRGGRGDTTTSPDGYRISGDRDGGSRLICQHCGKTTRLKSHKAIDEEFRRQGRFLLHPSPIRCPKEECPNHNPVGSPPMLFRRFGTSEAGSLRFQCRACKATFSIGKPTNRQRRTYVNGSILDHLISKMPLQQIVRLHRISFPTLYGKIDWLYRQCALFAASREARIGDLGLRHMRLAIDRQDLIVNWPRRSNRQTIQADYLTHGHFHLLRHLLRYVPRLHISIDADAGMLGACLGAFAPRIAEREVEVVQVRILKEQTVDQRRRILAAAKRRFAELRKLFPNAGSDWDLGVAVMTKAVAEARAASPEEIRKLQDVWFSDPRPQEAEPERTLRFVTDVSHLSDEAAAIQLLMGTLWPVDTAFAALRHRVAMFGRGVSSVRRARRLWHVNAAYDPTIMGKLLEINRVAWNYLRDAREPKKRSPAEKLGLAQGEVRLDHIIGFDIREMVERLWRDALRSSQEP